MASTLAGLLIFALFITTSVISFRATLFGNVEVSGATRESSRVMGEISRTEIAIDSAVGDTFCSFTLVVTNPGATRVSNIDQMDVIVQFGAGNNIAQRLVYVPSGPPSIGQWTDTSRTPTRSGLRSSSTTSRRNISLRPTVHLLSTSKARHHPSGGRSNG